MVRGTSPKAIRVGGGGGSGGTGPEIENKRFHSWLDSDDEVGTGGGE